MHTDGRTDGRNDEMADRLTDSRRTTGDQESFSVTFILGGLRLNTCKYNARIFEVSF